MEYLVSIDYGSTDISIVEAANDEEAICIAKARLLKADPLALWLEAFVELAPGAP